ncbi:MAG: M20/M25/M40 family metallo-hydrolase [Bacteroidales bacterium]|nr:M20/M25/M40 family metallo-hydrolase [Bacteroidales bacterium]
MADISKYVTEACVLLEQLVRIPSLSFEENECADYIQRYLEDRGVTVRRIGNNLTSREVFRADAPTLMLCAHIDTVPAAAAYTFDPLNPPEDEERILGLGSNDDGGSVVSAIATFLYFKEKKECPVNLLLALTCEEERSGHGGMHTLAAEVEKIADFAIVGEPTCMQAMVAERGLLVLDATAKGRSAHAARAEEGDNALYKAIKDIEILKDFKFDRISPILGEVRLNVTQISSGTAHNVIPETCSYVVDIRPTECYSNTEIVEMLQSAVKGSELKPRNLTNRSSATPAGHLLISNARALGIECCTSPTTSDWMRLTIPAIKMGPGDSRRSHKADEYILRSEVAAGIRGYVKFIENL